MLFALVPTALFWSIAFYGNTFGDVVPTREMIEVAAIFAPVAAIAVTVVR